MPKTKKFPKKVFVHWEGDRAGLWLDAAETTVGVKDGEQVAIYQLVEVKTQRVTEELV